MARRHHHRLHTVFAVLIGFLAMFPAQPAHSAGKTNPHQIGTPTNGSPLDNKLSAGLRFIAAKYQETQALSSSYGTKQAGALYDGTLYYRLAPGLTSAIPEAHVFIKVEDPARSAELEGLGVRVITRVQDILVASMPITSAYHVAGLSNVQSVSISGQSHMLLNLSRIEAKVDAVHTGTGLDRSYRGGGTIVGVLDSGIDITHPDFQAAATNTRILSLLDYGNAGPTGNPTEFTKTQIDAGQCNEIDGQGGVGHGTHVTGIASGGGRRNTAYIGMAPASDILFVKGIRDPQSKGAFADVDVVTGVQWMFNKATALGKPCVINLSLGGHSGPHDGTGNYEQALSSLTGPGRIVVAAAGNEGAAYVHTSWAASGTSVQTAPEVLWEVETGANLSAVEMWYPPTGSMSVGIGVYTIQNSQLVPLANTTPQAIGQRLQNQEVRDQNGNVLGTVTVDASTIADPNNGARNAFFVVQGANISNYVWSVYAFGTGTLDAWVLTGGRFVPPLTGLDPLYRFGDNDKSVGVPATAKKVICVGAYVSKTGWTDFNGTTQQQLNPGTPDPVVPTLGNLSYFSSRGPSRDGRTKPDLVAPGEAIMSALSAQYTASAQDILQGGGLQKEQGTSQASPHVTGIVALMLEKNKYLTYENVLSLLSSTALPSGEANLFGAGKVRALNALQATPAGVDCASIGKLTGYDCEGNRVLSYQLMDAYPNPFNPATTITYRMAKPEYVTLVVYDMLGRLVKTLQHDLVSEGQHLALWDGSDDGGRRVASGFYFTRLSTAGFEASNRLLLLK